MSISRALLILFMAITAPLIASAQSIATKPVRIIVPYPPGGVTDGLARAIAHDLTPMWGKQVLVENRPGANAIIGTQALSVSAPDGNTILLADRVPAVVNPLLYSQLPYNPKDLVPVIALTQVANVLTVSRDLPVKSLQEFVALAKSKPGALNYGSLGLGSVPHLDAEAFSARAGIKMTHVPYKGMNEVLPSLMASQIHVALAPVPLVQPLFQARRVNVVASGGITRSHLLPDVPTFAELGFAGIESRTWFGLFVPGNTSELVVSRIAADVARVISNKPFTEKFVTSVGMELVNQGPAEFAATIRADSERYREYVKSLDIKLN